MLFPAHAYDVVEPIPPQLGREVLQRLFLVTHLFVGVIAGELLIEWLRPGSGLAPWALGLTAALAAIMLSVLWSMFRLAPRTSLGLPAILGGLFVAGGSLFDILVTLLLSNDFEHEANRYLVAVVGTQISLTRVYGIFLVTQVLFVGCLLVAWLTAVAHVPLVKQHVQLAAERTFLGRLKVATGGGRLSYRAWLLPLGPAEFPQIYFYVWPSIVAVVTGVTCLRWLAGFEWIGWIEPDPTWRLATTLGGSVVGLLAYLAVVTVPLADVEQRLPAGTSVPG